MGCVLAKFVKLVFLCSLKIWKMIKIPVNIPFHPSRIPFFYGWVALFAGIIGILMSIPGQTMGVSVFTDHLINDLPVDRVQLSTSYMIGTIMSGLIITYAGVLYDRMGARVIAMGSGFMLGVMLFYMSRMDSLSSFFRGLFSEDVNITIFLLIFGFFGIRFFGQGVLTMTSRNMVMKWFDKRRGFANGILGVFTAFGFSYSPRLLQDIISGRGWNDTWLLLAYIIGILFLIFVFVFFRDNPGDAGQIPDGRIIDKKSGLKTTPDRHYDLGEAIRTYSFWIFNLNITLIALYITAFTFHVESIFSLEGMDTETAFSIFFPAAIVSSTIHVIGSWISDYIRLKYILIFSFAGMLLSAYGWINLGPGINLVPLILGNGMVIGTFNILIAVTWPRFYNVKHLGKISGFVISWSVVGSGIGPFLFSLSEKHMNSYNPAVYTFGIVAFILLVMAFKANNINDTGNNSKLKKKASRGLR
jgi:MFS family permease